MNAKLELLRTALSALFHAFTTGKCERVLVIGINKNNPLDSLLVLDYPEGEGEEFREQILDYVKAKMGN